MVHDHDMFGSMWVAEQKAKEANKGRTPKAQVLKRCSNNAGIVFGNLSNAQCEFNLDMNCIRFYDCSKNHICYVRQYIFNSIICIT